MITIMRNAAGETSYCFNAAITAKFAALPDLERYDAIAIEVGIWVSENEGYNSLDYARLCEQIEVAWIHQVNRLLELEELFGS